MSNLFILITALITAK